MANTPPTPPPPTWEGLLELGRILRSPQGCPWDRKQTLRDLAGHLVEDSYEVLHAVEDQNQDRTSEELGDLAFVLALVFSTAEEKGGRSFAEIAHRAVDKIVRRHPHVFGENRDMDPEAVERQWERIKRSERGQSNLPPGSLPDPPPALPALLQAYRLQQKAASVGFDWPSPEPVYDKVEEELEELRRAAGAEGSDEAAAEEVGDLLFAVVNLSRALKLDPEACLRKANRKFRDRFNQVASLAAQEGTPMEEMGLERLDALWDQVKSRGGGSAGPGSTAGGSAGPGRSSGEPA